MAGKQDVDSIMHSERSVPEEDGSGIVTRSFCAGWSALVVAREGKFGRSSQAFRDEKQSHLSVQVVSLIRKREKISSLPYTLLVNADDRAPRPPCAWVCAFPLKWRPLKCNTRTWHQPGRPRGEDGRWQVPPELNVKIFGLQPWC